MKNIIRIFISIVAISMMMSLGYAQDKTESQKSSKKFRQRNLGVEQKKSQNKIRRGGIMTYPQGIAAKKFNIGFTLGGDIALMDALEVEKCPFGANFTIFMHGVLKNTNTVALGTEIKGFYFLTNKDKLVKKFSVAGMDVNPPEVKVDNWLLTTVQFSVLGNFNPLPRFNLQIKGNIGPLIALVPPYEATYQFKERQFDGTYKTTTHNFKYEASVSNTLSIGVAFTTGMDVLYAITKNTEFKFGLDWSYLRFNYTKIWQDTIDYESYVVNKEPYAVKEIAQFGVFDIHVGFAFSF